MKEYKIHMNCVVSVASLLLPAKVRDTVMVAVAVVVAMMVVVV